MKRSYSLDESRVIFNYLAQKHASEQEVIELLGHQSKIITHPAIGKPQRIFYFIRHSLFKAEAKESWAVYNEDGTLQHFVSVCSTLNGLALWKYRFGLFSLYGK